MYSDYDGDGKCPAYHELEKDVWDSFDNLVDVLYSEHDPQKLEEALSQLASVIDYRVKISYEKMPLIAGGQHAI